MQRFAIAAVLIVALLVLPLWLARGPAHEVDAVSVERGRLRVVVATNATVEPIREIDVRARLEGRIVEVRPAGTHVATGDVIVRLDATHIAAELESARSRHLEAEESLRQARMRHTRAERSFALDRKLFEQNALSEDRLDEVRADRDEARARLEFLEREVPVRRAALELMIEELQAQLAAAEITAPFAGTIYRCDVDPGETVRQGQRILTLGDLGRLQLRAHIDQVDLGRVQPGNPIDVTANAFPDRRWRAQLTQIIPHVEVRMNRAVAEATAEIEPPVEGLVPGMNVDIEIVVDELDDVLQVPSRAIFAAGEGPFVFRLDGARVAAIPVQLGRSSFSEVEVIAGLAAGDQVVLGPAPALRDGAAVRVRRASDGTP